MRPTWAEIDLEAVKHNFSVVKELVGKGVGVLSVVKADGYGHGAVEVSKALVESGTDMLGVATVEEAMELRDYGIEVPIMLLGGIRPEEAGIAFQNNMLPCLFSMEVARALDKAASANGKKALYHLKIDTGMTRLGVRPEELTGFLEELSELKNIQMDGILTHLASAFAESPDYTEHQLSHFIGHIQTVREFHHSPRYVHTANSASVIRFPGSHMDLVRPGIMLYTAGENESLGLRPAMKLKSRIIQIRSVPAGTPVSYGGTFVTSRPSVIATLPLGYADGYLRRLSNRAHVSVNGVTAPVAGTVCMDLTMIDVTDVPGLKVGDEVTLFGDELVSVERVADWAETISYEILSITGKRVPRIYL
jgi:alanine racemase